MVMAKAHKRKARQIAVSSELVELALPLLEIVEIGVILVEAAEIRIGAGQQRSIRGIRLHETISERRLGDRNVRRVLFGIIVTRQVEIETVIAHASPGAQRLVPDVACAGFARVAVWRGYIGISREQARICRMLRVGT